MFKAASQIRLCWSDFVKYLLFFYTIIQIFNEKVYQLFRYLHHYIICFTWSHFEKLLSKNWFLNTRCVCYFFFFFRHNMKNGTIHRKIFIFLSLFDFLSILLIIIEFQLITHDTQLEKSIIPLIYTTSRIRYSSSKGNLEKKKKKLRLHNNLSD